MKVSPIDRIPYKVELHIFSYCDASELFACSHVRRRWHALLSRDDFWSSLSLVNSNRASAHTAYHLRDEQQSTHRGKRTGTAIVESIKTSGHGHRGGDTSGGGDGFVLNEGHTDDYYSYWNTNSNSSSQSRRASASSSPQFTIRVSCPPSRAMEYTMRLLRHICFLPSFTCGDARSLLRMKRSGGDDDYRKQRRQWGNASSSSEEDEEDSSDASCSSDRRHEKEGDADVGSFFSSANRYAICSVDPNGWTTSLLGGLRVSPSQYAETTMSTISIYFRISMLHGSSGVDGDDDHDNNSYQANTMWSMVTEESPSASASRSQRQGKAECIFGVVDATHASAYLQRISNDEDTEALWYNQRSNNNYSHHSSNVKQRAVEVVDEVDQLVSDWFSATVASIEAESRGGDGNNNNNSSDRGHLAPLRMAPAARTSAFVSYADEDGIGGGIGGGGVHVGDSVYSYGFTSRGDLLHNGTSSSLSSTPLREGDVVGIHFKLHEDVVSVTHNRDAVGVIATDAFSDGQSWMPAVSCRGPCIVSLMPPYLRASNF